MSKANYEAVVIFSVKAGEEAVAPLVEKFKALIEENATLNAVDEWGKRRLAYPINYETEGYYVLYTFEAEPEFPAEFERIVNITDSAIRTLVVKVPEAAIAQAKAKAEAQAKAAAEAAAEEAEKAEKAEAASDEAQQTASEESAE